MAYDRYEGRRGRHPDFDRDRGRDRRDERGFFERAGDEIASWFGDDDRDRGRGEDDRWGLGWNSDRDFDRDRHPGRPAMSDRERGRWDEDRGEVRSSYRGNRGYERDFSPRGYGYGPSADRSHSPSYIGARGYTGGYGYDYGAGSSGGYGSGGFGFAGSESERDRDRSRASGRGPDRHYESWRQRQIDELDRDYDEYRREHQQRFENEFGSWRQTRQQKRGLLGQVREHMDVVGSDGETVGKVDCVRGDRIILTKSDSDDNRHHRINCSMVDTIDGDQVKLTVPAEEAKSRFEQQDDRAMFGRDDERGEVNLERSFSGTYR